MEENSDHAEELGGILICVSFVVQSYVCQTWDLYYNLIIGPSLGSTQVALKWKLGVLMKICFVTFLFQAVERAAGSEGQKITYNTIKQRLGDIMYRLV
jgi:hypothetical protein